MDPAQPSYVPGDEDMRRSLVLLRQRDMLLELADELHPPRLDPAARIRLGNLLTAAAHEVSMSLGAPARAELHRVSRPFSARVPSEAELRISLAQLTAWLEGALASLPDVLGSDTADGPAPEGDASPAGRE